GSSRARGRHRRDDGQSFDVVPPATCRCQPMPTRRHACWVCSADDPSSPLSRAAMLTQPIMDSKLASVSGLLHQAAETHHVVYAITDGSDPDWASWYADWLVNLSSL